LIWAASVAGTAAKSRPSQRDLARARNTVVYLPNFSGSFGDWFHQRKAAPLLDINLKILSPHTADPAANLEQADGIYLRDPESLLFKEWARGDLEHSPPMRARTSRPPESSPI